MKFLMMMHTPRGGPYQVVDWAPEALKAHLAHMDSFLERLRAAGELVDAQGLAGPDQAKLVKASASGRPQTDGVFPESKEFLAGFWVIEVDSPERAYQRAAEASLAPGPDGRPLYLSIEVRQILPAPKVD
ncbi:MAG: YciI family protein [Myxococcota bacterium]